MAILGRRKKPTLFILMFFKLVILQDVAAVIISPSTIKLFLTLCLHKIQ